MLPKENGGKEFICGFTHFDSSYNSLVVGSPEAGLRRRTVNYR